MFIICKAFGLQVYDFEKIALFQDEIFQIIPASQLNLKFLWPLYTEFQWNIMVRYGWNGLYKLSRIRQNKDIF